MTTTETPTVDQLAKLIERLSLADKARLMDKIAEQIGAPKPLLSPPVDDLTDVVPVITGGTWSESIPTRRADLYTNDERC